MSLSKFCNCGCGGQISIKKHHKYYGVPKYIKGHNPTQNNAKHGGFGTRLYRIWQGMKNRCFNLNDKAYKWYGNKGITVCPEWANDYTIFRDWSLNNGYTDNLEIDRKNSDKNYEPSNCRWVDQVEQGRNRKSVKLSLEIAKKIREKWDTNKYTLQELADNYDVCKGHISDILHNRRWWI